MQHVFTSMWPLERTNSETECQLVNVRAQGAVGRWRVKSVWDRLSAGEHEKALEMGRRSTNISTPAERALTYIHLPVSVLYGAVCTPWHTCGSQWTTGGNWFSPSTTWFPVLNLGDPAQWQVPLLSEAFSSLSLLLKNG